MALKDILEKIIRDAEEEGEKKVKEARREAEEIVREAEERANARGRQILEQAEKQAEEEKKRIVALARLEARTRVLERKREFVDEAFQRALEKIPQLPKDRYLAFLEKLVVEGAESGNEELILSEKDKKLIDDSFLARVNEKLRAEGKSGNITLSSEVREIAGGVVLKKSGMEIDASLKTLLREIKEAREKEVLTAILGGEAG